MRSKDSDSLSLQVVATIIVAAAVCFTIVATRVGEGFAIPVGIAGAVAFAVVMRGPVGKALARRLEGASAEPSDEVLQTLEDMRVRLGELEERLDFTERVLAQSQAAIRLAQPGDAP
jgi:hypothetical protein